MFADSFLFQQNHTFHGIEEASIFALSCRDFLLVVNQVDANGRVSVFYLKGELRVNSISIGPLIPIVPLSGDVFTISKVTQTEIHFHVYCPVVD